MVKIGIFYLPPSVPKTGERHGRATTRTGILPLLCREVPCVLAGISVWAPTPSYEAKSIEERLVVRSPLNYGAQHEVRTNTGAAPPRRDVLRPPEHSDAARQSRGTQQGRYWLKAHIVGQRRAIEYSLLLIDRRHNRRPIYATSLHPVATSHRLAPHALRGHGLVAVTSA